VGVSRRHGFAYTQLGNRGRPKSPLADLERRERWFRSIEPQPPDRSRFPPEFPTRQDRRPLTAEFRLPERIGLTGLSRAGDTWSVPIEPFNSNFGGSIYGGAALGAAVEMLECVSGSRVRWATARFLRAPSIGSELVLSHVADFVGRRSSHMTVTATHGDQVAFEVTAVVGRGDQTGISGQWAAMPAVPQPADCPAVPDRAEHARNAAGQADRRTARAGNGDRAPGRSSVWTRLKGGGTSTPAGLAWIADSIAAGLSRSVGPLALATSLDNTIRYAAAAHSEWVLVDVHAHASADGYAYGDVHLFSESGTLLATGSQTCIARVRVAGPAV
jgi:acyl-CoA thioesterase II